MENYMLIIYGLLLGWTVFSLYYIFRLYTKGYNRIIPFVYETIPNVFTTLGILGTFLGIYFGLQKFDVNNITESIPSLLEGLKTAFVTSIWGIILALLFGRISQIILNFVTKKEPPKPTDELAVLNDMHLVLKETKSESNTNFAKLNSSLIGEGDESIATQFVKLRNQFSELLNKFEKQTEHLKTIEENDATQTNHLAKIQTALGGQGETSLLTQIQKLRAEQNDYATKQEKSVDFIVESMYTNNELIRQKFDEFAELLAKNNTEALVDVMKNATDEFSKHMSSLIEKLVQENFKELNNSVQRMNDWQKENKEMISSLTHQFKMVSEDISKTSTSVKEITENTSKLTDENSNLTKLIGELQKVMIEDTKYQEIVGQLTSTIDTLKNNTETFDETTNKLNDWVRNQMNFNDSVAKLLVRLEQIDKIKDINEVFWDNTRKQLNEGVAVIEKASKTLSNDLDNINDAFYERLNDTLQNLDALIQRVVAEYR